MGVHDRPPRAGHTSVYAIGTFGIGATLLVTWTALVAISPHIAALDQATLARPPDATGAAEQIAAAIGVVFWPGTCALGLLGLAAWSARRRLRNLAVALMFAAVAGGAIAAVVKLVADRPRPPAGLGGISEAGPAYPSAHVALLTTLAILVVAVAVVTRQRRAVIRTWQAAGLLAVAVMAWSRWWLRANWVSDLVGGLLLGGTVAALALTVAGVRVLPRAGLSPRRLIGLAEPPLPEPTPRRCAIILNPSKITDEAALRRHLTYELDRHGFGRTLWLETSVHDSGRGAAEIAAGKKVDLVVVVGGDGTVRAVCGGLVGTGIAVGIVPAGTGNLLARNLGIPMDERAAIDVAFDGFGRAIDLVRLRVDDQPGTEHFAVMAGLGFDAAIFEQTSSDLKRAVGSAAYFVAGARAAGAEPFTATVSVDGQPAVRRRISVFVIGNVGLLQGGIQLFPSAEPDDGLIDVLIAAPRSLSEWARLVTKLVARPRGDDAQLTRLRGRAVRIIADEPEAYQIDGDTVGHCRRLAAEVQPGAVIIRVPG